MQILVHRGAGATTAFAARRRRRVARAQARALRAIAAIPHALPLTLTTLVRSPRTVRRDA